MTKDELIGINARLEAKIQSLQEQIESDELRESELRETFSKILGSTRLESEFGYSGRTEKTIVLNWTEIACEVGKLLARKTQLNSLEAMNDLQKQVSYLSEIVFKLEDKKEVI